MNEIRPLIDKQTLVDEVVRAIYYTPRGDIEPTAEDILNIINRQDVVSHYVKGEK